MPLNYIITANWQKDKPDWYNPLDVVIKNNTDTDIESPKISFDISKVQNITGEFRAYTGFAQETFAAPIIKGTLTEHLKLLKAHSTTTLTFGVNFSNNTVYPVLPTNFTFNDQPIVIPEDHTPPTKVEGVVTAASGPTGFSLNWTPSRDDDTGVEKYVVKYTSSDGKSEHESTTSTNSISLKNLAASTKYAVTITAVDYAGNVSVPSSYEASTDAALKGPARWQEGTHIKGSSFVDSTAYPTPPIDKWAEATGLQGYFLGFLTTPTGGTGAGEEVKACWGGNKSIYDGNDDQTYDGDATVSNYYKSYINNLRAQGKDIIMSFGGASNHPIEQEITDIKKIKDIYLKVIDNYKLTAIDLDFEGSFLDIGANKAALERHIGAITEVIKAKPELKISYTLPVDGAPGLMGFNSSGVAFLKMLNESGITPSLINGMSMEFGQGSSTSLFECARLSLEGDAANDTDGSKKGAIKQIQEIWTNLSTEQIYKMTGLCTMYGKHLNGKVNTVNDQAEINKYFVGAKGLGNVNGWDASIDMNPEKGGGGYNAGDYGKVVAAYEPDLLGSHAAECVA